MAVKDRRYNKMFSVKCGKLLSVWSRYFFYTCSGGLRPLPIQKTGVPKPAENAGKPLSASNRGFPYLGKE